MLSKPMTTMPRPPPNAVDLLSTRRVAHASRLFMSRPASYPFDQAASRVYPVRAGVGECFAKVAW
jgi:hypothetical protein